MIGARSIVSCTLGRVIPDKDRSCIPDVVRIKIVVGHTYYKMLRTIFVDQIQCSLIVLYKYQFAVGNGFFGNGLSRQFLDLFFDFLFNGIDHRFRSGNQDYLTINSVLGLTQQVCSNKSRIGGIVRHHQKFTGTGGHINGHSVFGRYLLGYGHELISGTKNFIYLWNAFGPKRHPRNSLNPSDLKDLSYST